MTNDAPSTAPAKGNATDSKRATHRTLRQASETASGGTVTIGLSAVIVTVARETPFVLLVHAEEPTQSIPSQTAPQSQAGLPSGPFDPQAHRTLEIGLRNWVEEQTFLDLGYVEQLYTFGDRNRQGVGEDVAGRIISIGYLALTRDAPELGAVNSYWDDWYTFFPWEDWRDEKPALIDDIIVPALQDWTAQGSTPGQRELRRHRVHTCFGLEGAPWDEEKVLDRYELLYEAGLVEEAARDHCIVTAQTGASKKAKPEAPAGPFVGLSMVADHRRILATGIARLRGKLKYRPLVFELMPPTFTLLHLQRTVEAISGIRLHKQNFRRLLENGGLVERTGRMAKGLSGRPAEQFRFRREVLLERPAPGFRVRSPGSKT